MAQPSIFISYSHEDEKYKEELVGHLRVLELEGLVDLWVDDKIGAGGDWEDEIDRAMKNARLAILLITKNFLVSDFIRGTEVPALLKRRRSEGLDVFPVIARPCAWQRVKWLARLNVRPKNGSPVWRDGGLHADDELAAIAHEVADLFDSDTAAGPAKPAGAEMPETVLIPAGVSVMGSRVTEGRPPYETPRHEVELPDYKIGKYPVTNEHYAEFVAESGHPAPDRVGWFGKSPPRGELDHPVVGVSWFDALAYCAWMSERTAQQVRLPTEAEWEKAARGVAGQAYPWGNEWDPGRCVCASSGTSPVTAFPSGRSPFGCHDLIGNVWEWTSTIWGRDSRESASEFPYPYRADDGREASDAAPEAHRLYRGGSFADPVAELRCSARRWYLPSHRDRTRGFRVVLEA